ncbi:MAG TPA: non-canonical purine NTP pyrophosphatase [archaeon]|nr:non-canonical purine NTP pyrophosphatase [archaeon]
MQLYIATTNKHKVSEISAILSTYSIDLLHKSLEIVEPDYDSLDKIAKEKARQAFEKIKKPVIVEDTGVFFEAYNDFPGMLAKRVFLGIGFDGLIALIKRVQNKRCHFKTVICYYDGKEFKSFSGTLSGTLLENVVSLEKDRLPYEKIFVPDGYKDALADIDILEKNKISHRSKAAHALGKWLAGK